MDAAYAAAYAELAANHWWWQAREARLLDRIRRLRRGLPPARILDVGCGDGRLFPPLEAFGTVEGIEPDVATLGATAPAGRRIHHVPFDAPLPVSGPYDLILMLDVVEHLDAPVERLRLARSLLAPGGVLLVTVPALPALWTRHDLLNHHRRRYTQGELRRQLQAAGLGRVDVRYAFHALAAAKLAVRLREQLRHELPVVPRLPAPWINRMARRYHLLEGTLLGPFARWLPGSSLIATASTT
ncbi:MAG: class I SAM-dependent methyltransferase [Gemmatimonadota bacterium]